jgi:hypothetical protein
MNLDGSSVAKVTVEPTVICGITPLLLDIGAASALEAEAGPTASSAAPPAIVMTDRNFISLPSHYGERGSSAESGKPKVVSQARKL